MAVSYRRGGEIRNGRFKDFLHDPFGGIALLLGFIAGVTFGYFVELFGQITFSVAMELGFETIFAKVLDDVFFAKFKIQIDKRHHQHLEADQQQ